jgi:formate dehydrogenase major subunit
MYAMGWTQHTVGTQNIRTMAIIQLLLGNMGVAGGGVNALRGESNVQGSTDHCLLWHIWPGYLKTPRHRTPPWRFTMKNTPPRATTRNRQLVAELPQILGQPAEILFRRQRHAGERFRLHWMPKADDGKVYSWLDLFDEMYKGKIKGFFAWGQNPACSGANANKTREAMKNLDWMVNVNIFDNETGSFWRGPGMDPATIKTEVFFLPACVSVEKEGSITNSGRWMQWRYQGPKPLGNSLPTATSSWMLGEKLKSGTPRTPAFRGTHSQSEMGLCHRRSVRSSQGGQEINGYFVQDVTIKGKT